MLLIKPVHLCDAVPPGRRLLGIDVGTKTLGLALSDITWQIASPLTTIHRKKFRDDSKQLMTLMEEHDVGGLLLGLPINMDGSEGPRCQGVRQFANNLLALRDLPLAFWDERLSTAAVERMLIHEADISRKRRSEVIDKLAATYILQGALDSLARR